MEKWIASPSTTWSQPPPSRRLPPQPAAPTDDDYSDDYKAPRPYFTHKGEANPPTDLTKCDSQWVITPPPPIMKANTLTLSLSQYIEEGINDEKSVRVKA